MDFFEKFAREHGLRLLQPLGGKPETIWLAQTAEGEPRVLRRYAGRDTLCRKLGEIPGVVFDVPGGAFYVMAALPVDDADKFQQWLLEEFSDNGETVMMAPGGSMYATPGKGKNEVRMAYVLESDKLERAMEILKKAIEAYNAR